jgi:PAS domain S-box-containing protein
MKDRNRSPSSKNIAHRLHILAKEKEVVRQKLVITARKLSVKAKQLAVIAKEKEAVRRKLLVTAEKLRLKAKQLATTAREKEQVRRKLLVTAQALKISRRTLENKVLERTKDLEQVKAKEAAILASIGNGLVAIDTKGKILLVNKASEKLLGWQEKDMKGKYIYDVVQLVDSNNALLPRSEYLVTKTLKDFETRSSVQTMYYKRKDGSIFPVVTTVAPIFIGKKLLGAVKVFRDITKEKEIEKAKSEFMAIASHQLRTPLTAIRWVLSSLKRETLPDNIQSLVHTAHETSMHMAVTIKRMLMISFLEEDGKRTQFFRENSSFSRCASRTKWARNYRSLSGESSRIH